MITTFVDNNNNYKYFIFQRGSYDTLEILRSFEQS